MRWMCRGSPVDTIEDARKTEMTTLASIAQHHIYVECRCGHNPLVPVAELAPHASTVEEALDRMRCAKCGRRGGIGESRIVWVGNSAAALPGSAADR